jgi:hypothetical protein
MLLDVCSNVAHPMTSEGVGNWATWEISKCMGLLAWFLVSLIVGLGARGKRCCANGRVR